MLHLVTAIHLPGSAGHTGRVPGLGMTSRDPSPFPPPPPCQATRTSGPGAPSRTEPRTLWGRSPQQPVLTRKGRRPPHAPRRAAPRSRGGSGSGSRPPGPRRSRCGRGCWRTRPARARSAGPRSPAGTRTGSRSPGPGQGGRVSSCSAPGGHRPPTPSPGGQGAAATPYLAGAAVLALPSTVVDVWGTEGRSRGAREPPAPPAGGLPPILTDVAVAALPARDAITVIATNQVFARKSVKAWLPFALIGVCGRDKRAPWGLAPLPPRPPPAATAAPAAAPAAEHAARGPCTRAPRGPYPGGRWPPPTAGGRGTRSRPPGPRRCRPPRTGWRRTRRCLRRDGAGGRVGGAGGRPGAWVPWGGGPGAWGFLSCSPGRKAHSHMGGRDSCSPSPECPPPHPSGAGCSPPSSLPRTLTQRARGSTPAGRAVALEARGHLMARAPVGTGVGGAGVLSCIGNRRGEWAVGGTAQGPTFPQCSPPTPRLQGRVKVCPGQKEAGALGLTGSGAPAGPGRAHLPRSQFLPE